MPTCEDGVGERLYNWFADQPVFSIVSFHPPSGKAYATDIIRIPKVVNGKYTGERYHVDLIVASERVLYLIELKCRLSESNDDITKLREIVRSYGIVGLLNIINKRSTTGIDLSHINSLVIGLGFQHFDMPFAPSEFITFTCTPDDIHISIGVDFPPISRT